MAFSAKVKQLERSKTANNIRKQVKRIKIHSRRESMFIEIEMDMHEKSRRDFM